MANLPAVQLPDLPDKAIQALVDASEGGLTLQELARKVHPTNKQKQKVFRARLRRRLANDQTLQAAIGEAARANLVMALPAVASALAARAKRGNPRAITIILEATGFYNPRAHSHEHSGEIEIKLAMPRPPSVDGEIVDAEVVE